MSQSDRQFELLGDCEQRTLQNCENLAPKFSVSYRKGKGIDPLHSPLLS